MKNFFYFLLSVFLFADCIGRHKKIEITHAYIINANWNEKANAITISRLNLKNDDFVIRPNLSQDELLNNLEESDWEYVANIKYNGAKYSERKIFFNEDNGFYWYTNNGNSKKRILGNLSPNTWYKFSRLVTYPFYVYVYIDSANKAHIYNVNLANY